MTLAFLVPTEIREEIRDIEAGKADRHNNVLKKYELLCVI